jgi:hypothetical protein
MRILRTIGRGTLPLGSVLLLAAVGVVGTAAPALAATTPLTLNTVGGPSGGGNTVTGTVGAATFTAGDPTSANIELQYRASGHATCALTYQAGAAVSVSGTTQSAGTLVVSPSDVTVTDTKTVSFVVPSSLVLGGTQVTALYNVCIYDGTTVGVSGSDLIADTDAATGYTIAPNKLTLNSYQGPSGGGNTITGTSSGGTIGANAAVEFQFAGAGYCTATYGTPAAPTASVGIVAAPATTVLTTTKVAVTVPTALALDSSQSTANYNVCVYASTGSGALIAGTALPYVIAPSAAISTVTPSTGPAQGGTALSVAGSAFPLTGMTATLGGIALTNVQVASNGNSFTATAPPHPAGGPFSLVVTTQGGTTTKAGVFTYSNGITSSPTTAANSTLTRTALDVRGVGFTDISFTNTNGANPNGTGGHVYLVKGGYDPKPTTAGGSTKTNPQTAECVDVVPVDDTEIICSLFVGGTQSSAATTRTLSGCVVAAGATALAASSSSSTTCTFTAADVGLSMTGTGIAAGTIISAVGSATTATLSKTVTAAVAGTVQLTVTSNRAITDGVITLGSTSLTSAGAPFTSADIGRAVSAPGVLPNGTYVVSVSTNTATLSNAAVAAATGTGAASAMTVFVPYGLPNGTYTVTVVNNGAVNAQSVSTYTQSIITSGSTFTIADYLR